RRKKTKSSSVTHEVLDEQSARAALLSTSGPIYARKRAASGLSFRALSIAEERPKRPSTVPGMQAEENQREQQCRDPPPAQKHNRRNQQSYSEVASHHDREGKVNQQPIFRR